MKILILLLLLSSCVTRPVETAKTSSCFLLWVDDQDNPPKGSSYGGLEAREVTKQLLKNRQLF